MEISRVGTFTTGWGESVVWDDVRSRLYFVDCATHQLLWLDHDGVDLAVEPGSLKLPSMPTGVVPTRDGQLVVVLDDGLYRCDVDAGAVDLVALFPDEIDGRCNDACADLQGNVITGELNFGPADAAAWRYSPTQGWSVVDPAISNTNGPAHLAIDDRSILIIGDTSTNYYGYDYDGATGRVGERWVFGDTDAMTGGPDGTTVDAAAGLWCAIVGGAKLLRFTVDGLSDSIDLPVTNPTDVTFGGPNLDRLFITTIGGDQDLDGAMLVIDGLPAPGRPEPRAAAV